MYIKNIQRGGAGVRVPTISLYYVWPLNYYNLVRGSSFNSAFFYGEFFRRRGPADGGISLHLSAPSLSPLLWGLAQPYFWNILLNLSIATCKLSSRLADYLRIPTIIMNYWRIILLRHNSSSISVMQAMMILSECNAVCT